MKPPTGQGFGHVVITRMSSDPRTQTYIERRMDAGRSKQEAIRALKRHVARELYHKLQQRSLAP